MKALVLKTGGSIDGFQIAELPTPAIKDDELLVKVHATGMNPSDYQTAEFLQGENLGIVLGLDVAGEVAAVGAAVKHFKVGDRVFYIRALDNPYGGFAEYSVTPERFACRIPDEMSFGDAAMLPGAGFTAYHIMMQRFHLVQDRTILIQGGAGGVGSYAIQIAKRYGLKVITTCMERDKDYVLSLGADVAIDFQNEDVYGRIKEETDGKGLDYALSSIGVQGATRDFEALRFGGELAITAGLPNFAGWKFYDRGITLHEIAFGGYLTAQDMELQKVPAQVGEALAKMVSSGEIHTPQCRALNLEEVPDGLRLIKAGEVTGKLIVKVNG